MLLKHKSTTSGLIDVIEKYARNNHELRAKLNTETSIFRNSEGDFGRKSAVEARNSPFPDEWWELYGCQAPHLQKLAIRVLSQTCSSSGCERNWSVFEHIH
ncbi:putative HAT dimerization domain, ribonuclease H-like domain-containing protein [Medicago truncatula]|uniref:Putative HAT dimerization domain, ribonuclease H-like domain-containing protein n=1 Tax=Medicago truncatula TaxID=3880 RepID=A0A396I0L6_MEDTR|nr:putative HAT dimerization domain, ribonuclease H-like domain-containing protein [Medicago truncatula]